jgi:hypothetical protein
MICHHCRDAADAGDFNRHSLCWGALRHYSHCDCQHEKTRAMIEAEGRSSIYGQAIAVPLVEVRLPVKRTLARATKTLDSVRED